MNTAKIELNTRGLKAKWIGFVLSMISFWAFFLLICEKCEGIYKYVYALPFSFGIINLFFLLIYNSITIIPAVVIGMEFIRFTITPLIVYLEGFPKGLYVICFSNETMILANVLMIYELVCVYYILYKTRNNSIISVNAAELQKKLQNRFNYGKIGILSIFIIVITLILFVVFPQLVSMYSFVFSENVSSLTGTMTDALNNLPSGIGWIASALVIVSEYSIIQFLIFKWFNKYCHLNRIRYIIFSLFLVVSSMLFISSSVVISLILSLVLLLEIYILYPKYRRFFVLGGVIVGTIAFSVLIKNYLKNVLMYQSISQMVQDYTNGYYSVYQGVNAYKDFGQSVFDKVIMFFWGDGVINISPLEVFFSAVNSSDIYNNYIYGQKFNGGAVLPYVSQCTYYFSIFIGPALSAIPIYYARKFEKKWRNCDGNILINGFVAIVLGLTPFMYNISTFIHIITVIYVPLWIGSRINRKFVVGRR